MGSDTWSGLVWVVGLGFLILAVPAVAFLAGAPVTPFQSDERVCSEGEFVAKGVGNPSGGYCVKDGELVTPGYVLLPANMQPVKIHDKWDRYWDARVIDAQGRIVGIVGIVDDSGDMYSLPRPELPADPSGIVRAPS